MPGPSHEEGVPEEAEEAPSYSNTKQTEPTAARKRALRPIAFSKCVLWPQRT